MDQTLRKVKILRSYLATLQEFTRPSFDVDSPVRGGIHGAGSRLGTVRSWLMPEILLCLNRTDDKALFLVLSSTGEVVHATLDELDRWLAEHDREIVHAEVSAYLRSLQRYASRLPNRNDKSSAHKAVSQLRRAFDLNDRKAAT